MTKEERVFWGIDKGEFEIEVEVLDYLKEHDKFIFGDKIVENTSLKSKVELRKIINILRKDGNPIVATSKGYKYSNDKDEIYESYISMRNRAEDMIKAANGLFKYLQSNKK